MGANSYPPCSGRSPQSHQLFGRTVASPAPSKIEPGTSTDAMDPLGVALPPGGMKSEARQTSGLDPLLSIEDLAEFLGVPVTTIYDWRVNGKGPCGIRVGHHVKFAMSDVLSWLAEQ